MGVPRVKIFRSELYDDLENDINNFIIENNLQSGDIINISYSNKNDYDTIHSALIAYKSKKIDI